MTENEFVTYDVRVTRQHWLWTGATCSFFFSSYLQDHSWQDQPSACKGWILAWVQPQERISWVSVAGRRRCLHCPKMELSPFWLRSVLSGCYCSLGSTWFCGEEQKKKKTLVACEYSCNFHFWHILKFHKNNVRWKKSIPLNNCPFTLCFRWNLWNRKGNSMWNVMKNKFVLNKNKWELPHSIRGKKISPINTTIKVANPGWVKYKQTA